MVVACLLVNATVVLAADPTIRLSGLPEPLEFPLPAGSNPVLTAQIEGGAVRRVWLADKPDAARLVALTAVGAEQYAVNLADPELAKLLEAIGAGGMLRVFAESADGRVIASIPVRFVWREMDIPSVEVWAVMRDGTERKIAPIHGGWYVENGISLPRRDESERVGDRWCDPVDAVRLELRSKWITDQHEATARSLLSQSRVDGGVEAWRFQRSADGRMRLDLNDAMRFAWTTAGAIELSVAVRSEPRQIVGTIRAIPATIKPSRGTFVIQQRRAGEVPGAGGYWWLRLGDVSGSRVDVRLIVPGIVVPVRRSEVSTGDVIPLRLRDGSYVIAVDQVVNLLIGDDYVVFNLFSEAEWKTEKARRVERLIQIVSDSGATFIRNGKEYSSTEAAAHLRRKLDASGLEDPSPSEFIDAVASKSSMTGEPYLVRFQGGEPGKAELRLDEWLREQLATAAGLTPPSPSTSQPQDEP